ncbi:MAG: hypothetical protein KDA05_10155 [Phycisphaerales bacterium]|nr:hypothetical protein [Phycisphaerales bacterium]
MNRTAADAYAAHRADIARLLDVLGMELDKHADTAKREPADWGRAGDLAKVRGDLIGAVAFLAGMDPANVEAFLAE